MPFWGYLIIMFMLMQHFIRMYVVKNFQKIIGLITNKIYFQRYFKIYFGKFVFDLIVERVEINNNSRS